MLRIALYALVTLALFAPGTRAQTPLPIYPPALRPGDTIAVVAPAGKLEQYRVEMARSRLQRMGFKVRVPENLYRRRGYLAGDDDVRAEEFMAAFRDPAVKAIYPGTGGFGVTRMLDRLDYDVIRANPKILIGYSDITGLHLAIQRKTGLVTFHGPVLMYGLGSRENLTDFSAEYLWRAVLHKSYLDWSGDLLRDGYTYYVAADAGAVRGLTPGKARGRLTGGNLSLVCTLMGTPYEIETDGRILFLEDVNEEPYRIDRYLSQLRLAGKFDRVAGVVLGIFTGCESSKGSNSLSLDQVLNDYFANLNVPVIKGFPAGHYKHNATLPLNVLAELDADQRQLRLLENPVRVDDGSAAPSTEAPLADPGAEVWPPGRPESDTEIPALEPEAPRAGRPEDEFEPVEQPRPVIDPDILRRIP